MSAETILETGKQVSLSMSLSRRKRVLQHSISSYHLGEVPLVGRLLLSQTAKNPVTDVHRVLGWVEKEISINPYDDLPAYEETVLFYNESDLELVSPSKGYYFSTKINREIIESKKKYKLQYQIGIHGQSFKAKILRNNDDVFLNECRRETNRLQENKCSPTTRLRRSSTMGNMAQLVPTGTLRRSKSFSFLSSPKKSSGVI
ncbi:uncharacterized protein RJT20DRAFT_5000 [Scheffersomyces xylosifermentans]|uniref:uncharacterized protein n=1 Tax=Scheffersomyces xylosifermentans TaxID=1304137 RepID=UPI00315DE3EC